MMRFSKILMLAAASISLVGMSALATADTGADSIQHVLDNMPGGYVVIVPGPQSKTVPKLLTLQEYDGIYGTLAFDTAQAGSNTEGFGDGGEDQVPTPPPPFPSNYFQSGDKVELHRGNPAGWNRITVYVFSGSGSGSGGGGPWWMERNVLSQPGLKER